ncbi:MAG: hypothetical protein CMO98_12855 [Woeseia sp.]|nr:hypothetical protein [Woeseia sp.]
MAKVIKKKVLSKEQVAGGERLHVARKAKDIPIEKIAQELNLDEEKVRALETNEFALLGAPVFAKGHLRNYAKLVDIDVKDIMTDYYKLDRAAGLPPVVGERRRVHLDIDPLYLIIGAIGILFIIVMAYWFFSRGMAEDDVSTVPPATNERFIPDPMRGAESVNNERTVNESTVVEFPEDNAALIEEDAPTISATPQIEIELSYIGDCWTEISDNAGRRLFYDLGQSGRVVKVSGDAPVQVFLGDARAVDITVAGNPWPLTSSMLTGQPIRLTIPAQ